MTWLGMEAVVDAAVAALKSGMGAAVTAVNATVTDDIEITAPNAASYLVGISMDELEAGTIQLSSPTVIVTGADATPDSGPDTGGEYVAANELSVSVLFTAQTLEERVRLTWRYQRAVIAVLCADDALVFASGDACAATWRGSGYLERTIPQGVWRDAVCLFTATTFETP